MYTVLYKKINIDLKALVHMIVLIIIILDLNKEYIVFY